MASKLTQWINASLQNKGMTAKQAQKGAGKYKSIAAAKKAGSLYYKDKNGKIQIAAYAEDLKKIPKVKMDDPKALKGVIISKRPVVRGQSQTKKDPDLADKLGKEARILRSKTTPKANKRPSKKVPTNKKPPSQKPQPPVKLKDNIKEAVQANEGKFINKGKLKTTSAKQVGLRKLPKSVRNKMGYMSKGGMTTTRKR